MCGIMGVMKEIWKDILGFEGVYKVSNYGDIKRSNRSPNRKLMLQNRNGYKVITLHKNGVRTQLFVHRLVATAFIKNPLNKPFINHLDSIRSNNNVKNLGWCTSKENAQHALNAGRLGKSFGELHGNSKLTEKEVLDIKTRLLKGRGTKKRVHSNTGAALAKEYGVSESAIKYIKNGETWSWLTKQPF